VALTDHQRQILPLFDGVRDVASVIEESGLVEFDVGKALYGLVSAGFAHRVGRSQAPPPTEVNEARIQEHRNLGIAFFKTGMLDEAAREFRRVVELRPSDGDAQFYMGLVALKQARWRDATTVLRVAAERLGARPAVLHNLALAFEQLGQFDHADSAYGDAAARARYEHRIMTGWGIVALQRGEYAVAASRLDRAREIAGDKPLPPMWYWARGLAAAAEDDYEEAEATHREGLERYPKNAVLSNNLAALLEILGDVEQAEEILRGTLADEQSLPQLSKNLGDILYRAGRYDDAAAAYQRAVKLDPKLGDDVYFKLGKPPRAGSRRSTSTPATSSFAPTSRP
jgi:tetratricopeptide (TPR) repeat protein